MKILIVEDDSQNRFVLLATLEALGYQADSAVDGIEAKELMAQSSFDLLIIDIKMPRMNGFDLARFVRGQNLQAASFPKPVALLALTANILANERSTAFSLGFNAFLSKPFRVHEIRDALASIHSQLLA